jgi:hypothetical protein
MKKNFSPRIFGPLKNKELFRSGTERDQQEFRNARPTDDAVGLLLTSDF